MLLHRITCSGCGAEWWMRFAGLPALEVAAMCQHMRCPVCRGKDVYVYPVPLETTPQTGAM